jgi:hypothetical protein
LNSNNLKNATTSPQVHAKEFTRAHVDLCIFVSVSNSMCNLVTLKHKQNQGNS